jgi:hypothetical protein
MTRPLGPTPLAITLGTLICACLGSSRSSDAADLISPPLAHVAAAAIDSGPSHPSRRDLRSEERIELEWLLAQSATPPTASGETIIAVFPSSAPESVEEDVAKEHKLEFVRRLEVGSSDRRIVVYRVRDGRSAAEAVAALKGDLRVSSTQPNVRYTLPPQRPAPAAVSDVKQPADRLTKQRQRRASRPDAKVNLSARTPGSGEGPRAGRDATAAEAVATRLRSGQRGSLVTSNHTALRWPTADEPFVNIGARNR